MEATMKFLYYLIDEEGNVSGTNDTEQAERYQDALGCVVIYTETGETFDYSEKKHEHIEEAVRIDESGVEEEEDEDAEEDE